MDQMPMDRVQPSLPRGRSRRVGTVLAIGTIVALAVGLLAGPTIGNLIHPRPTLAGTVRFGTHYCPPTHRGLCLKGQRDTFTPGRMYYIAYVRNWLPDVQEPGYDVVRIMVHRSDSHGNSVVFSQERNLASKNPSPYGLGTVGDFESPLDARHFTPGTYTVTVWWEYGHSVEAQGTFRIT